MDKAELIDENIALWDKLAKIQMQHALEPWRKLEVPLAQLKSLFLIHIQGSMNVRNLAAYLRVTPGNVTSIVDRLVGQRLVKRSENPEDRRLVLLELTEKGQKTVKDIHETGINNMRNTLEKMTIEDLNALKRGVNILISIVEEDQLVFKINHRESRGCPDSIAASGVSKNHQLENIGFRLRKPKHKISHTIKRARVD